uniref:Probable RNA polymerase II nuclear localization protein SLC7A6OS n=1 Tax=Nyssomyia neivai TaxID=330878 RepID=A0A1L8DHX0_9DIPT
MAAVIRVKRKVDEEPLNAFVLNCKRRKIIPEKNLEIAASSSSDKKEESYTILKFAGTVETQDEDLLASRIKKISMEEAKARIGKTRVAQPVVRARDSQIQKAHENRFKIVNCSRAVDTSSNNEKTVTILDIEKQIHQLNSSLTKDELNISTFVYDLYMPEFGDLETDIDHEMMAHHLSIQSFEDHVYGNGLEGHESDEEEETDSNDESNWRNEYPDSDPDSIDERDLRKAVENFDLDNDSLSTDGEGYSDSAQMGRDEAWEDCDDSDDSLKGRDYERYHRMLKLMSNE